MEKPNILIVDDHDLSILIQKKLWKNHFNVKADSVKDSKQAIKATWEKDYDLIVLDLNMPGMSGYELLDFMRKHGIKIPILIVSSENHIEKVKRCLTHGATDYLLKPIITETYFHKISKMIDLSSLRTDLDLKTLAG